MGIEKDIAEKWEDVPEDDGWEDVPDAGQVAAAPTGGAAGGGAMGGALMDGASPRERLQIQLEGARRARQSVLDDQATRLPTENAMEGADRWVRENLPSWIQGQEAVDTSEDFQHGANQGLTLGFSDEIEAGARSAVSDDIGYDEALSRSRRELQESRERSPLAYGVGELLGTAETSMLAGGNAPAGASRGARIGYAATENAALGGIQGMGTSEGNTTGEVLQDTGVSTLTGGLLGGAMSAVGEYAVPWATRHVRNLLDRADLNEVAATVAPNAGELLDWRRQPGGIPAVNDAMSEMGVRPTAPDVQNARVLEAARAQDKAAMNRGVSEARRMREPVRIGSVLDDSIAGDIPNPSAAQRMAMRSQPGEQQEALDRVISAWDRRAPEPVLENTTRNVHRVNQPYGPVERNVSGADAASLDDWLSEQIMRETEMATNAPTQGRWDRVRQLRDAQSRLREQMNRSLSVESPDVAREAEAGRARYRFSDRGAEAVNRTLAGRGSPSESAFGSLRRNLVRPSALMAAQRFSAGAMSAIPMAAENGVVTAFRRVVPLEVARQSFTRSESDPEFREQIRAMLVEEE